MPVLGGPLLAGQQHRRGAVGERRRVAGRHRALGAAEHRLQLGQLLERRVGAQVLVALETEKGHDQIVEPAGVVGGGQVVMAADGELVLLLAADPPLGGHDRGVLAHRQPGAGLGVAGDLRDELLRAQPGEGAQPRRIGLGPVELEQHLAQVLVERERRVGGGVHAAGDADVDLAERDLVGDQDRGLEPGAARLLDVVGRGLGGELGAEHGLAGQVEVTAVLEHRAGGDLAEASRPRGRSARSRRRASRSACPGWRPGRRGRSGGRRGSGCRRARPRGGF